MDRFSFVILAILFSVVLLVVGGVFAEPISAPLRRHFPNFKYDGQTFLLVGLLAASAFAFGMVVMYLILKS